MTVITEELARLLPRSVVPAAEPAQNRLCPSAVIGQRRASSAAVGGLRGQVAYAATKAGLLGMVRTLALELAPSGATVNAILPGFVATERVKAMPTEIQQRVLSHISLRRYGTVDEVADLVAFLSSDAAAYITARASRLTAAFFSTSSRWAGNVEATPVESAGEPPLEQAK